MEDWTSVMKRISLDYELFNGYAIEVIRTSAGKTYHHIDFANVRVGLDGSLKYANDWINEKGTRNYKPNIITYEKYDPTNEEQKKSIIYHTDYRPNFKYYPLPVYVGSMAEIRTDVQIGDYWLNEVSNGFVGGTVITHNNGVPETEKEKRDFEDTFGSKFADPKGTKIVHLFAPSKDNAATIENLNGNDLHERYVEMSNRVKESIFIGHGVTNPILFGVKEEGQLGGRNELDLAYEIFSKTYVVDRRNTLLRTINKLCFIDTGNEDIEVEPLKPVDTLELSSDVILENLTQEEIRALIVDKTGLELGPLPAEPASGEQFSDEDISHRFENIGQSADGYDIISSNDISFSEEGTPIEFAIVTELQGLILSAILGNPLITTLALSELLDRDINTIIEELNLLVDDRLIRIDADEIELTPEGKREAETEQVPDVEIMYRYELRSDAPPLKSGGTSRPFCKRLMQLNKLYSREEIDLLRNDMDSDFSNAADVWLGRGGWYRKPNTDVSVPFCRHIWKQVIVRKK